MICIKCTSQNTNVVNSRLQKKTSLVWRRRQCAHCKSVFTTHETPRPNEYYLVHSSKETTPRPYNLGRLVISIGECFSHDPERGKETAIWLAQSVERQIATFSEDELVTSSIIAHLTHTTLKRYDAVAAVQYAARHHLL